MEVTLDELSSLMPQNPIILEAGACDGLDTVRLAKAWPKGTVHAFEPVPHAYQLVVENVEGHRNVVTYELALSDQTGSAEINVSENVDGSEAPDSSSLLAPTGHLEKWPNLVFPSRVTVPTTTLDDWAERTMVSRVDLLWLDLQGMELRVLKGSPRLLSATNLVYMELWREPQYAGSADYKAVVKWMKSQGFKIAYNRVHRIFGNAAFVRA